MDKRIFAFADTESVLAFVKMTIAAALYFLLSEMGIIGVVACLACSVLGVL